MIISKAFLISATLFASSSALSIPQSLPVKIPFFTKESTLRKRDGLNTRLASFTDGAYYYAKVEIGTPAQMFDLVLDTGSADLYVNSRGCSKESCPFSVFDERLSSTYIQSYNDTLNNTYGVEPNKVFVNGSFGYDVVTMGGITVKNQKFARAFDQNQNTLVAIDPEYAHPDGIVGLGFPGLTNSPLGDYNPLLFTMYQQGLIPAPVFSWYYGPGLATSHIKGELILGGADPDRYVGDIQYIPVLEIASSNIYWQSYIQTIGVTKNTTTSNATLSYMNTNKIRAVFDTGTPLSVFPTFYINDLYFFLTGIDPANSTNSEGKMYQIDCEVARSDARVSLEFSRNGNNASTDPHPLIIEVPISSLVVPNDSTDLSVANECYLAIQTSDTTDFFLLGQTILHNFYLSFDFGENKTGFGVPVNSTSSVYIG